MCAIMTTGDRTDICRRIEAPTLILHGTADPLIKAEQAEQMASLVPNAVYVPLEDAGHDITPSLVPVVLPRIADFIRSNRA